MIRGPKVRDENVVCLTTTAMCQFQIDLESVVAILFTTER